MRKCKECKLFKNGCGFSQIDEKLDLNGNFVACGQFVENNSENVVIFEKGRCKFGKFGNSG